MKFAVGDLVRGKYRIQRLIGDGGMGSVYEARHEALNTQVALKFLHADLARRPGLAARFAREARVAAGIQSPHVTRVNDVDTTEDGAPFIVMELLQGQSLATVLSKEPSGRLSPDEAIDFALQILAGLEAAHARGVVHRDLKPDNVFVTPSPGGPVIKLFDFGIAKVRESKEFSRGLTHAGILMGTPEYMAPEQLYSAAGVDHRADLYSLGVMLFEMLSGQLPAEGESAAAIVAQVQMGTARRLGQLVPELPADLVAVVETALAPDPAQRFESAHAMRNALAHFANNLSHAGQLAARPGSVTTPPLSAVPARPSELAPQGGAAVAPFGELPDTVPPDHASASLEGPSATERTGGDPARPATVLTSATPGPPAPFRPAGYPQSQLVPPRRKGIGPWPWVLGSLAILLGGAIGIIAYQRQRSDSLPAPVAVPSAPPPARAPEAETGSSQAATTPANTSTPSENAASSADAPRASSKSAPVTHQKPPAPSTGGTSSSDTKENEPPAPFGIPLPLPSNLPPLPSSLPPLPESITSALPTSFPPLFQPPAETPQEPQEQEE